jgi:NADH-quinone oxidoreductase subunit B/C/D
MSEQVVVPPPLKDEAKDEVPVDQQVEGGVLVTTFDKLIGSLDKFYNWGRRSSLWPLQFGIACCAIEFICTAASRFDLERFGAGLTRASPRQADVLIVSGTVTKKMLPKIIRLYNQMAEPKYVISMGACATGGGPFKEGYNVVSGIDKFLPVDVYIPGCPPTPQAFLHGLMALQAKIDSQSIREVPWYRKDPIPAAPEPLLGPDLIDPRQIPVIREKTLASPEAKLAEADGKKKKHHPKPKMAAIPQEEIDRAAEAAALVNQVFGEGTVGAKDHALVVPRDRLLEVVRFLHDTPDLALDYLANLTSVDYPDRFEVVYNLASTQFTPDRELYIKTAAEKEDPVVPSLVSVYAGADFQEREVWDMMGIRFAGHPNLKRILLWDGFEGFPLRKDYHEAYYEQPHKPLGSRWPAGRHQFAEERAPFGRNVRYPTGWDPEKWEPAAGATILVDARDLHQLGTVKTQRLVVNLGPQHPSTHGVFQMQVALDGETIADLQPIMGYLHRNHEKIAERNLWLGNMPFTDRLDYICSMSNNLGYAIAVEKLLGVKPPERAEYIRVIMAELTRIVNHIWAIGFLLNDLGAFFTPALYAIEERELILDFFEATAGSRMMCNYMRFGGVAHDIEDEWLPMLHEMVHDRLPRAIDELDAYLTNNEIVQVRARGVGVLPPEMAINYSASGPVLRASGVPYDVRRAHPYSIYDRFDFDIPTMPNGDVFDRYYQRILEARESLRILEQALAQLPEGPIMDKAPKWQLRVPAGEAYGRVENPKGELGFYLVSDGSGNPYRYHVRSPSFINLTVLRELCIGHKVADIVGILGSIDIVLGEVDR